jgi:hypothetical protein
VSFSQAESGDCVHSTKQPLSERTSRHVSMTQHKYEYSKARRSEERLVWAVFGAEIYRPTRKYVRRAVVLLVISYKSVHNLDRGSCLKCALLYKRTFTASVIENAQVDIFLSLWYIKGCRPLLCPAVKWIGGTSDCEGGIVEKFETTRPYSLRESGVVIAKSPTINSKISQANFDSSTATETDSDPDGRRFWGLG